MDTIEQIIQGLMVIKKYKGAYTSAEHDSFFAGPGYESKMSDEDKERMEKLGWQSIDDGDYFEFYT